MRGVGSEGGEERNRGVGVGRAREGQGGREGARGGEGGSYGVKYSITLEILHHLNLSDGHAPPPTPSSRHRKDTRVYDLTDYGHA